MDEDVLSPESVRCQLAAILESKAFSEAPRSRQLLAHVVENCLNGETEALKESVIALEVFGKTDFDPQLDSLVRGAARRLRKSLRRFYEEESRNTTVLIDLPEGHYIPTFSVRTQSQIQAFESMPPALRTSAAGRVKQPNLRLPAIGAAAILLTAMAATVSLNSTYLIGDPPPVPSRLLSDSTSNGSAPIYCDTHYPISSLLVTPDGSKLYAFEQKGKNVMVFDTATLNLIRTVSLPTAVYQSSITRDGRYIFSGSVVDGVISIDTITDQVATVMPTGGPVMHAAVMPGNRRAFLAMGSKGLCEADLKTGRLHTIAGQISPQFVALNPEGTLVYASYMNGGPGGRPGHDAVVAYDVKSGKVVHAIRDVPRVGGPMFFRAAGDLAILNGQDACSTPKYDHVGCPSVPSHVHELLWPKENNRVEVLGLPVGSDEGVLTSDGSRYVYAGETISVLNLARRTTLERFNPGRNTTRVAVTPKLDRVFATLWGTPGMLVFKTDVRHCPSEELGLANLYAGDGTLDDVVGAGTATSANPPTFAPGVVGQAFRFSAKPAGFLTIPYKDACVMCLEDWTISLYFQLASLDGDATILKRSPDKRPMFRVFNARDNRIGLQIEHENGHVQSAVGRTPIVAGKWYRLHVVHSSASLSLYLDGKFESQSDSAVSPVKAIWGDVFIGGSPGAAPLNGMVDEVAFYSRAMSPREIEAAAKPAATGNCGK